MFLLLNMLFGVTRNTKFVRENFSLLPLFEKNNLGLWDHLSVCAGMCLSLVYPSL
jgi:hypothetical protein